MLTALAISPLAVLVGLARGADSHLVRAAVRNAGHAIEETGYAGLEEARVIRDLSRIVPEPLSSTRLG